MRMGDFEIGDGRDVVCMRVERLGLICGGDSGGRLEGQGREYLN